jgi:hypothetical protein
VTGGAAVSQQLFVGGTTTFSVIPVCSVGATSANHLCNYTTVGLFLTNFQGQANTWSGTNTFNTTLPTSTISTGTLALTDIAPVAMLNGLYGRLTSGITNTWASNNTFSILPSYSGANATSASQLITKGAGDAFYAPISGSAGYVPTTTSSTINITQTTSTATNTEVVSLKDQGVRAINFIINAAGGINGSIAAGDSVIWATAGQNSGALTLTTWSTTATAVRIAPTNISITGTTTTLAAGTTTISGLTKITNVSDATTATAAGAALLVDGGVGIAKKLFVGGGFDTKGAATIRSDYTNSGFNVALTVQNSDASFPKKIHFVPYASGGGYNGAISAGDSVIMVQVADPAVNDTYAALTLTTHSNGDGGIRIYRDTVNIIGTCTADTQAVTNNSRTVATTAYVKNVLTDRAYAPLASPTFTGTAAAPTQAVGDNSTKLATTAYVKDVLTDRAYATLASPTFTGTAAMTNATMSGTLTVTGVTNIARMVITEASRTSGPITKPATAGGAFISAGISPSDATLVLNHSNSLGTSSILFNSVANSGSDYAYIQFFDHFPYATGGGTAETSLLLIGVENDPGIGVSGADRIVLMSCGGSGYVGVNTLYPEYSLHVYGTCAATSFNATSDYRMKNNIQVLKGSVDLINPVEYDLSGGKHDMGFLAHEVQEIFPFLVDGEKDGNRTQTLNYNGFIALLVKEVKDLKKENRDLNSRLQAIEAILLRNSS